MKKQRTSSILLEIRAGFLAARIFAPATRRVFLSCTNHLSDRELYAVLWHKSIVDLIEHVGPPDTIDDQPDVIDQGRGAVRLWWD